MLGVDKINSNRCTSVDKTNQHPAHSWKVQTEIFDVNSNCVPGDWRQYVCGTHITSYLQMIDTHTKTNITYWIDVGVFAFAISAQLVLSTLYFYLLLSIRVRFCLLNMTLRYCTYVFKQHNEQFMYSSYHRFNFCCMKECIQWDERIECIALWCK